MSKDKTRYDSLKSILGYLSHSYKDSANAKAIIFYDEEVSDSAEGGTGKSLMGHATAQVNKTVREDGKTFKPALAFSFQQVEYDTKIFWIDDVTNDFKIEPLFTPITNSMNVEKKYQGKITIPFERSPKFLLTSNYMIMGIGKSYKRRMVELEFSPYYNENNTPEDEFGHRLFDDWNEEEWILFHHFMLTCIQLFLNQGIIEPPQININKRKLLQGTAKDFVEFVDTLPRNKEFNKTTIFQTFIGKHPDFQKMRQRTFTSWLKMYAIYTEGVNYTDRHANGDRYFILVTPPPVAPQ